MKRFDYTDVCAIVLGTRRWRSEESQHWAAGFLTAFVLISGWRAVDLHVLAASRP
jgi:hypothetical protein